MELYQRRELHIACVDLVGFDFIGNAFDDRGSDSDHVSVLPFAKKLSPASS
ncbi:hypothetical protein D3C72_2063520 [compost metagenome]